MKIKYYVLGLIFSMLAFFFFRNLITTINYENNTFDPSNSDWVDEESGIILKLNKNKGIMYFEGEKYPIRINFFSDSIKIFYAEDESFVFFNAKIFELDEENMVLLQSSDTINFVKY
jgi:hypothetical protein